MHVLLVEDDLDPGAELQRALAGHGLTSEWVRTAKQAQALMAIDSGGAEGRFACVLLDLGLPDGDGVDLLRHWRRRPMAVPVIALTARDALDARVTALDAGADDCVNKPCAPIEIASRVRAVVRRSAGQSSQVWRVGKLQIDTGRREVQVDGETVALSPKEYHIVLELARLPEAAVPKHRLVRALAPLSEPLEFGVLEWHIHNLRRKIGAHSIRTVRGVGYCLVGK